MPALHVDQLQLSPRRLARLRFWSMREWCFLRTVARHLRWRLLIVFTVLMGGGLLFQKYEPEKNLSLFEATYYTWSLVFGEPPEAFPQATVLRILFFLIPVLGLTVIIEALVDLALLVRDRQRCERSWCITMASSMKNHIVLVGFGRLGFRAFRLLRRLGEPVVVIERDAANRFLEELRRDGSPLLLGDARDDTVLQQSGVQCARSIVLATNDDLANLEIALDARRMNADVRVVLRMFDQNMADKIRDGFSIHHAMSQSALAAPAFAMSALDASIVNSFVVGNQLIVLQRWAVNHGGPLADKTVVQVMKEWKCAVAQIQSIGAAPRLFPPPDTALQPGDELLIQGPYESLAALRKSLKH